MPTKHKTWMLLILFITILVVIFAIPSNRAMLTGGEIRAAMDIGSGATNLIVAKVDPKTNKIITQLFEKSITVPYQKHLATSKDNTFDQAVMTQGIQAIKKLKAVADTYHAKKVVAVATAAFRSAANSEDFAKNIERETGVQIRIINQDEEGILAFRGALALSSVKPEHAIVWDIGGGSMQLTALSKEGTYLVEKGATASIPFKNAVIEQIEHKTLQMTESPNPMSLEQMQKAVNYASSLSKETNPVLIAQLKDPKTKVLAVGNLFNYGVKPIVGGKEIQQSRLEKGVMKLAGKSDAEINKGSLSEVAVTNPLLVLGYMKGLHISVVEVINVNNATGALSYPAYWE